MIRSILFCTSVAVVCHTGPTTASVLSGEFSGTAINSGFDYLPRLGQNFDGASITGSFDIEPTSVIEGYPGSGVTTTFLNGTGQFQYSIPAIGQFNQTEPLALIVESEAMGVQTLEIEFTYSLPFPYDLAALTLTGTGLFDPTDPLVLSPGMIDLASSSGSAAERFNYGTDIKLASVTFDTPVAVREPSTISLLALWAGGLMLLRSLPRAIWHIVRRNGRRSLQGQGNQLTA